MEWSSNDSQVNRRLGDLESLIRIAQAQIVTADKALVRTKWIDGDTTTPAAQADGSEALPYASPTAFLGAAPGIGVIQSVSDATQGIIGMVSPATVASYTGAIAIQPYRNVELRGIGLASVYPIITGNVTWTNTAAQVTANGGNPANAPASSSLALHNLAVTGSLTVTDDTVASTVAVTADEVLATNIGGNVVMTGATLVTVYEQVNAAVTGNITSTANATGANIVLVGGSVVGNITGVLIQATGVSLNGTAFATKAGTQSLFFNSTFNGVSPVMTLGAGSVATFDSISWASFIKAGGTVASGTIKLLTGNPPARVRYIDGGTLTTNTPTGDIESPFVSVSAAITAVGVPVSVSDADQTMLLKLCPSTIAAYTENPAFKAYRNYKLFGDGSVGQIGNTITGNMTWPNVAGGGAVIGTSASLSLRDITLTGGLTVTDDATMAGVTLQITVSSSELGCNQISESPLAGIVGALTTTGAIHASQQIFVTAASVGSIVAPTATSVVCQLNNAFINGNVTAQQLNARLTNFANSTITVAGGSTIKLFGCTFTGAAPALVAGAAGTITMDGSTWQNFQEAGGTITSGLVLVVGGSQAGTVFCPPTAAQPTSIGDQNVSISLNGQAAGTTNAGGFNGTLGGNYYVESTMLGAGRTVTIKTGGGELKGDTIDIVRRGGAPGAFTLSVTNNGGTETRVIAASQFGSQRWQFNTVIANDWGFIGGGGALT
jgi:hypothetical protein